MNKREAKIVSILSELYPEPKSELNFASPYQLLISVILSAQCTDKKVNQVTPELFKDYPDFAALSAARTSSVERIIKSINYYRTKAKNIVAAASEVQQKFSGTIPHSHEELTTLPGVGRKTANVVLGELGAATTFPVDTHVFRVSRRLGLAESEKLREVEDELCKRYPPELWRPLHHWLILHGRRICKAPRPLCEECKLLKVCPTGKARLSQ